MRRFIRRFSLILLSLFLSGSLMAFRTSHPSAESSAIELTISTLAGGGFGSNVPVKQAPMAQPVSVAFDPSGRGFYIVDDVNGTSLLRFVNTSENSVTLAGITILPKQINLIAGGGTGIDDAIPPRDADLAQVRGLAVTANIVYLAIPALSAISAINLGTQDVTVFGKTIRPGTVSTIAMPNFVDFRSLILHPATGEIYIIAGRIVYKLDNSGNPLAIAGGGNPSTGNGDGGPATQARLITPTGIAFDNNNNLLIADGGDARTTNGSVRRVNSNSVISSLATGLEYPVGIGVGPNGDAFVALGNAQQIVRITPAGAKTAVAGRPIQACDINVTPNCGDGGTATQAGLNLPDSTANTSLTPAVDARGIYLPDYRYGRVRFINLSSAPAAILDTTVAPQTIDTVVGSGMAPPYDGAAATSAELFAPTGVACDRSGNLFISDTGNNRLRFVNRTSVDLRLFADTPFAINVASGQIVTLNNHAGETQTDDRITTALFLSPQGLAMTPNGVLIVDSHAGALIKIPPNSLVGRRSGLIRFLNTSNADVVFFPNNIAARVIVSPGQIKDVAGVRSPNNPQTLGDGGPANIVAFYPTDVAVDHSGNIYLADQGNNRIRKIDASTAIVTTVYGDGTTATLNAATGVAFDLSGRLHIADTRNNRILRQDAPGNAGFSVIVSSDSMVKRPRDLTVDITGKVFITNALTHQILELDGPDNKIGIVAGAGTEGFSGDDGPAPQARLNLPNPGTTSNDIQYTTNITSLPNGDLVFADTNNNRIRVLKRRSVTTPVASVSAASFNGTELAGESITAAFGENLATALHQADSAPLPTTLGGTSVKITDSSGTERLAPLFFVAPSQINYQIPQGTQTGPANVFVTGGDGSVSTGTINITMVAPGLFAANANGQGVAAAVVLRVKENGMRVFEPVSQFDTAQNKFIHTPIDFPPATDQLFLVLFGSGFKFRSSLSAVTVTIGGTDAEVLSAGPADGFVGLDQANVRLPRSLEGRGVVDVVMNVEGKPANTVSVQVK